MSPWVIPRHQTWSSTEVSRGCWCQSLMSRSALMAHAIVPPPDACKVYKGHFHGHLWPLCPVIWTMAPS